MDEQKDIQKQHPLTRFFDKQIIRTNAFGDNQSADRAYRRAERVVSALYLITNHIPPTEQLRTLVREQAAQILSEILALRGSMRSVESLDLVNSKSTIRHQISLVRLLAVSGFLSLQNTNTMIEALDDLGNFLQVSQNTNLSENVFLSEDDFKDQRAHELKDIKYTRTLKDSTDVKDVTRMSDMSQVSTGLSVREGNILQVLESRGELSIRDISPLLPEYSEKMIQRDLARLVVTGRVKKSGLKRWSRYSIAIK